jgi:hypothetical protein
MLISWVLYLALKTGLVPGQQTVLQHMTVEQGATLQVSLVSFMRPSLRLSLITTSSPGDEAVKNRVVFCQQKHVAGLLFLRYACFTVLKDRDQQGGLLSVDQWEPLPSERCHGAG